MDPEVVVTWISDPHALLHAYSEPAVCRLPLEYPISLPRRRHPNVLDGVSPTAKRRRVPFADIHPRFDRTMSSAGKPDLRCTLRRKDSKQPGCEDTLASDHADANTSAHALDLQATPPPQEEQQPIFPVLMSSTTRLSASDRRSVASGSRERSSHASSHARSTSPVKNPDDLLRLEKPVSWLTPDPHSLRDAVKATESTQAVRLFNDVWSVIQGEGYLPRELKQILKEELMVDDSRFAADDRVVVVNQKEKDDARQLFPSLGADEGQMLGLLALHGELNTIRDIVATTIRFISTSRSEATWNDHVHGPILRLAVSSTPHVGAENISQACIADAFVPPARGHLETLCGKMIDYALVLRPERHLTARITDFVDGRDEPRTFNQSTHGALRYEPTGVFVETKVDTRRCAEGKAQLGIWLAAWYGRVARFAPLPSGDAEMPTKLPFLPVLLVVRENWELYFAFDRDVEFEVYGPLKIGSTVTIDGSYRLLEVLRLLAGWVGSEFRGWVERCVA